MKRRWITAADDIEAMVEAETSSLSGIPAGLELTSPGENRWSIKELVGHLVDSASNNHQRMVRLQYTNELDFPSYDAMNDHWVSIQAYQAENWHHLLALWKLFNLHIAHIIRHADPSCLDNAWFTGEGEKITLRDMITGYVEHLALHIRDIRLIADGENARN